MNNMPLESQKTEAITFPADFCVFAGFAHCCFDFDV